MEKASSIEKNHVEEFQYFILVDFGPAGAMYMGIYLSEVYTFI